MDLLSIEISGAGSIAASALFCKSAVGDSNVHSSLRNSAIGQWFLNLSCESESLGELVKIQSQSSTAMIP